MFLDSVSEEEEKEEKEEINEAETITDIIVKNEITGRVRDIIDDMVIKIQKDDNPENKSFNLDYLINRLNIKALEPLIRRGNRNFDAGMRNNPSYDTYIYDIDKRQILKIIYCNRIAIASYMIIKELAYQQYAKELSKTCDVEIPEIIAYGRIMLDENTPKIMNNNYECLWFILMEKMQYETLAKGIEKDKINLDDPETCNGIANKINSIRNCMENNSLYHNDFHQENILVDTENGNKIGILDFGLADKEDTNFTKNMNYTCDGLKEFKRNINLKSPVSVIRNSDEDYFGGKRKSRRKTNRRTSRRKTNRRKTTRRRKTKKYKK
jgi:hypothetical protein